MSEAGKRQENAPEAENLQRQLLLRVALAAGLIVVLLAGLAVYDRMTRVAAPETAGPAAQLPPTSPPAAPPPAPAQAPAESPPAETPPAAAALQEEAPSEPEMARAPEVAPPGQRRAEAPEPRHGAPRLVLGGEAPAPTPSPGAAVAPAPTEAAAQAESLVATSGKGYLIQMGVFATSKNAEALRARLEELGVPARLESRVVAGPFPDQAAARAAQARLRAAGQNPGLIVAPRR